MDISTEHYSTLCVRRVGRETTPALVRITGLGLNLGLQPTTSLQLRRPWPSYNGHPRSPRSSPARAPLTLNYTLRSSPARPFSHLPIRKPAHPCRAPPGLVPAISQLTPPATWPVACLNLNQSRAKKFPIVHSRGSVAPHSPSLLGLCGTTCVYLDLDLHLSTRPPPVRPNTPWGCTPHLPCT